MTGAVATRVDFLRHGATQSGDALLGRTDAPLSLAGRAAVARQVAGRTWTRIVVSPLGRARETANIAAAHCPVPPEVDAVWSEIDFGAWEGRPRADLADDARLAAFYRDPDANPPPGGESMDAVRGRIGPALARLATDAQGPVLVVSHGGAIRMALACLLAIPFARLWAVRIACATRISVDIGHDPDHGLWGEIVEIAQPEESASS